MRTNQEYKNEALAALKGKWAPALVASIAVTICVAVCTGPAFVSNMAVMGQFPAQISLEMIQLLSWIGMPFTILFMYPLLLGYTVAHRNLLEGDADVTSNTFGIAFSGWLRNVWAAFLMYLFTILWTFLLIIPGIINGSYRTVSHCLTSRNFFILIIFKITVTVIFFCIISDNPD